MAAYSRRSQLRAKILFAAIAGVPLASCGALSEDSESRPASDNATSTQAELRYSVEGVEVPSSVVELRLAQLTPKHEEALGGWKPVSPGPITLAFPVTPSDNSNGSRPRSYRLRLELDEIPDRLLEFDGETGSMALASFAVTKDGHGIETIVSENRNVAILPVVRQTQQGKRLYLLNPEAETTGHSLPVEKPETSGLATSESALSGYQTATRPFTITSHQNGSLTAVLSDSFFRDPYWFDFQYIISNTNKNTNASTSTAISGNTFTVSGTNGTYHLAVDGRYRLKYTFLGLTWYSAYQTVRLWEQDIAMETPTLSPSAIGELALKYAPIVVKDANEPYNPSSVGYIFNIESPDSATSAFSFALTTISGGDRFLVSNAYNVLPFNGHSGFTVNLTTTEALNSPMRFRTNPNQPVVYYTFQERSTQNYLHYHFLYAYDTKSGTAEAPPIGSHVFDRESITVVLPKDLNQPPVKVIYGQHLDSTAIEFETFKLYSGLSPIKWTGSVARAWSGTYTTDRATAENMTNNVLKVGTHPVAFVAHGSHALYPYPGNYYLNLSHETAGLPATEYAAGRVLMPRTAGFSGAGPELYSLAPLGTGTHTSSGPTSVLSFSGYMVDVYGAQNCQFPPFTNREALPDAYAGGSDLVNWNWLHASTRGVLRKLEQHVAARASGMTVNVDPYKLQ